MKILALVIVLVALVADAKADQISGPARVLDGDTVMVNGVRIRLKGIDAAERGSERGEAAHLAMVRIAGAHLSCDLTGEKTHHREVGFCFNDDGDDISEKLIAEGLALACPDFSTRYIEVETAGARAAQDRASYCLKRESVR